MRFRARIVDIDGVQILSGKLPRLNVAYVYFSTHPSPQYTEEHAADLCKVHQPGDARLVSVQSCEGLLPFRQDLIPPGFAGHIHVASSAVSALEARVAGGGKEDAI